MDLFNELLKTVVDYDDGIECSHWVCIPALGYLNKIADSTTIDRCIKELQEKRRGLNEHS
jgi:hypothetical protein